MKIEKILTFDTEDIKALIHFRAHIFHPMCNIVKNQCSKCPFNGNCSELEEFFDKIITDKQYFIGE